MNVFSLSFRTWTLTLIRPAAPEIAYGWPPHVLSQPGCCLGWLLLGSLLVIAESKVWRPNIGGRGSSRERGPMRPWETLNLFFFNSHTIVGQPELPHMAY